MPCSTHLIEELYLSIPYESFRSIIEDSLSVVMQDPVEERLLYDRLVYWADNAVDIAMRSNRPLPDSLLGDVHRLMSSLLSSSEDLSNDQHNRDV